MAIAPRRPNGIKARESIYFKDRCMFVIFNYSQEMNIGSLKKRFIFKVHRNIQNRRAYIFKYIL